MKIASTDLAMHADHGLLQRRQESETLRVWRGERPDFERLESAIARISDEARRMLSEAAQSPAPAAETSTPETNLDPMTSLIKQMVELITGKEIRVFDMQAISASTHQISTQANVSGTSNSDWGMEYDYHATREELEQTRFSAAGVVRTADGQELQFSIDLEMTRYYREETDVSLRAGNARRKDPLVVNFGGTAAELSDMPDQRFRFDIDGDGKAELLPLFTSGSGYLALDRNGNGTIDAAEELFGPATDNGFAELARLDGDRNGWIDEGDRDFAKLFVWTPAAEGAGALRSLTDLGIGALGVHHLSTPFALRGPTDKDLGQIQATGLYLTEDGHVGNMQEIDLTT